MTEIDNDMIERARKAMSKHHMHWFKDEAIRAGITAALSPPKPEIEVTEAMLDAGNDAWNGVVKAPECLAARTPQYDAIMRAVHRAMVKAQEGAAYAAKPAPQGVSSAAPVKETGGGVGDDGHCYRNIFASVWHHGRAGEGGPFKFCHTHRRKTD